MLLLMYRTLGRIKKIVNRIIFCVLWFRWGSLAEKGYDGNTQNNQSIVHESGRKATQMINRGAQS